MYIVTIIMQRHPDGAPGVDDQHASLCGGGRRQLLLHALQRVAARQLSPAGRLHGEPRWEAVARRVAQVHLRLRQSPSERR